MQAVSNAQELGQVREGATSKKEVHGPLSRSSNVVELLEPTEFQEAAHQAEQCGRTGGNLDPIGTRVCLAYLSALPTLAMPACPPLPAGFTQLRLRLGWSSSGLTNRLAKGALSLLKLIGVTKKRLPVWRDQIAIVTETKSSAALPLYASGTTTASFLPFLNKANRTVRRSRLHSYPGQLRAATLSNPSGSYPQAPV
eukprot:gene12537-15753_t